MVIRYTVIPLPPPSSLVIPAGFEPTTDRLEICCSIQLSYGTSVPVQK